MPAPKVRLGAAAVLRAWHLTSLDAPTVAVVWALGFAWAAEVRLPMWIPLLLALMAWAVYVCDRVLDARGALKSGKVAGLRERHFFHHRNRLMLMPLAVAATLCAAWIVFTQMPPAVRERNSALAVAALAYFTRVHSAERLPSFGLSRVLRKELLVGLLFTAACALPAISRLGEANSRNEWPLLSAAVFFALLGWLNCHAIEFWESAPGNTEDGVVQTLGWGLALAGLAMAGLLELDHSRCAGLVVCGAASAGLLAALDRLRNRMTPVTLRAAADLVLLTPLVLLVRLPA